ncbi:hypothetical protein SAMN05216483_6408 [Streptomyces sp. 2131.1]|nr:hypothetical protein SAMN05216483_6408 [Streptomyces sp. 2131.1]
MRNETDSYCVVNEADGVHYGGVEEVAITGNVLQLRFNDEAVEELELPSNLVPLSIGPNIDAEVLRAGLRRVFSYGNPQRVPVMNL